MSQRHDRVPFELTGGSAALAECLAQVGRAAADDHHVLVSADRGLDAEAVARAVHGASARRAAPCVVLPPERGAAELGRSLFGQAQRPAGGELEVIAPASALFRANGGTLFVAALAELPAPLQRRLARLLRDGEARVQKRAGTIGLSVRVIGAIEPAIAAAGGALRDDLARRFPLLVHVPALRERREDVPAIAEAMLAASGGGRRFTPAALTVLAALPWRRNVAELAGLIERLTANGADDLIKQEDVLAEVQLDRNPVGPARKLRDARRQFERDYIASVLRDHDWQMRDAARALGIERANLYRKARQLGIPLRRGADTPARITR